MAGTLGFHPSTAASPPPTSSPPPPAASQQWEVSFSRFFNIPPPPAPSSRGSAARRLHDSKLRFTGTWITAASTASLRLLRHRGGAAPSLSVSVRGKVYEEHFVSSLHYSWPQVSCVPECPIRGSRVVLMSYRDCTGQIQKFAVRFPASAGAETFMNSVKTCLREIYDMGHSGSDFACENSPVSEFMASNGLHNSYDEESNYEVPIATVAPEFPALTYGNDASQSPPQPTLDNNVESIFSGFPPSFTDMLSSCAADHQKEKRSPAEKTMPAEKTNFSSKNEGGLPDPSLDVADAVQQSVFMDESHLKAQIARYMSDASFNVMLTKIESVIDELGGDMAL